MQQDMVKRISIGRKCFIENTLYLATINSTTGMMSLSDLYRVGSKMERLVLKVSVALSH